jgi:hypothetical protein
MSDKPKHEAALDSVDRVALEDYLLPLKSCDSMTAVADTGR